MLTILKVPTLLSLNKPIRNNTWETLTYKTTTGIIDSGDELYILFFNFLRMFPCSKAAFRFRCKIDKRK